MNEKPSVAESSQGQPTEKLRPDFHAYDGISQRSTISGRILCFLDRRPRRDLITIVAFLVLGFVVYRITQPDAALSPTALVGSLVIAGLVFVMWLTAIFFRGQGGAQDCEEKPKCQSELADQPGRSSKTGETT